MMSLVATEEVAVAAAVVVVTKVLVNLVKEVAADAVARSSLTMTSLLCEQVGPACAALTKVNFKCLSHFTHAFRCE